MKFNRDGQSFIYFDYDLGGKLAEATFPKDENGVNKSLASTITLARLSTYCISFYPT